jgi:hypothetical protein
MCYIKQKWVGKITELKEVKTQQNDLKIEKKIICF